MPSRLFSHERADHQQHTREEVAAQMMAHELEENLTEENIVFLWKRLARYSYMANIPGGPGGGRRDLTLDILRPDREKKFCQF